MNDMSCVVLCVVHGMRHAAMHVRVYRYRDDVLRCILC